MHNFDIIRHFLAPVTLIGAGEACHNVITECLIHAKNVVAADGGARIALSAGVIPDAVIGDFDSISAADMAQIPADRLFRIPEQDSTDFDKCLARIKAPLILAAGFLGARSDHALAAFNTLVRAQAMVILVGPHDVALHLRGGRRYCFNLVDGARVSLFPMMPVCGTSNGLAWPIDGIQFAPGGRIGTSNRADGPVEIAMDGDGMIALFDFSDLRRVLTALG